MRSALSIAGTAGQDTVRLRHRTSALNSAAGGAMAQAPTRFAHCQRLSMASMVSLSSGACRRAEVWAMPEPRGGAVLHPQDASPCTAGTGASCRALASHCAGRCWDWEDGDSALGARGRKASLAHRALRWSGTGLLCRTCLACHCHRPCPGKQRVFHWRLRRPGVRGAPQKRFGGARVLSLTRREPTV